MGGDCKLVEVAAELWTLVDAGRGWVREAWRPPHRQPWSLALLPPSFVPDSLKQTQPEIAHNHTSSVDGIQTPSSTRSYAKCRYLVMAVFVRRPSQLEHCLAPKAAPPVPKLHTIDIAYENVHAGLARSSSEHDWAGFVRQA